MVLSSLAHYRGPLRPHHSPRRAAHRPASHSPRAAHRACLRLRRRYLRLMSKVRSRWGYALQCPPCPKLLGWCGWVRKIMQSFSLSRSPPILLSRDEPRCGPPATYNARRQEKPALPAAPFVALQISHHLPQPPTLLLSPPSLPSVRTLRLSLLHSQLPWVASLQWAFSDSKRKARLNHFTSGRARPLVKWLSRAFLLKGSISGSTFGRQTHTQTNALPRCSPRRHFLRLRQLVC